MRQVSVRRAACAAMALTALGAGAARIRARAQDEAPLGPTGWATARALGHLATDKPLYRPGETVYGRCALLDAFSRAPFARTTSVQLEVHAPRGEVVATFSSAAADGIAPFSWAIPAEVAGGEYKVVARFPEAGFAPAELSFDVRAYRVPRLDTQLDFEKKAYGPGDAVTATLHAKRAEGGIPAGARVTAVATVDSVEVYRGEAKLDGAGACSVSFKLPETIVAGEGNLALVVADGGVQETAARTIPIVVNKLVVEAFPEGGDIVGGLETRVYIEARTPRGKPADVKGRIVGNTGETAACFKTEHEGRARVSFTPPAHPESDDGRNAPTPYAIVIDEPAGVKEQFPLPQARAEGFTISSLEDATVADEALRFKVASTKDGKARVVLSIREREVASASVTLEARKPQTITLTPPVSADGVLRATVYDESNTPCAERLVFRRPTRALRIDVKATPEHAGLREHVKLSVHTSDPAGHATPAMVTLAAVDDAVLETVDKRERAARLPTAALLGSEVRELRDAAVYLEAGPTAAARTDLLLGTQGWRRFAFVDADAFLARANDAGARAIAWAFGPRGWLAHLEAQKRLDEERREREDADGGGRMFGPAVAGRARPVEAPVAAPMPVEKAAENGPGAPARPLAQPVAGDVDALARADEKKRANRAVRPVAPRPVVREFAHRALPAEHTERTDFAETLYWNAGVRTDDAGDATVEFDLADSVTTVRVLADGFAADGALGAGDATVEARRPFYAEPRLPLEVTAGDEVLAPVALVNGTTRSFHAAVQPFLGGPITLGSGRFDCDLAPDQRARVLVPFVVGAGQGEASFRFVAMGDDARDEVARPIKVVAAGFPREIDLGGRLGDAARHSIVIPEGVVAGSLQAEGFVYPSPLASLTQAIAALLQEPCGCFEQTSSTNYPNVMALQYLSSHPGAAPELEARARQLLDKGYERLVSFECRDKGYEWFGGAAPGHEALTAYGVLEFSDMAAAHTRVDEAMLARTRDWLLARRDGKGGFERNARAIDSFGAAPQDVTDAYITWALVQAHVAGLEKEIASVRERAASSTDAYYLALAANVLLEARDGAASATIAKLVTLQETDGAFRKEATSITRSGGESLEMETTALAILALLRSPERTAECEKAMLWLLERAKGGRFGSTQATVLALKAIVAYDHAHATPRKAGTILLVVDGKVYDERRFAADQPGPIVLPAFSEALTPGKHSIALELADGTPMPYSIAVRFHAITPASSERCQVSLATRLAKTEVAEGETVDLAVELANKTDAGLPMAVAIVGLPGGLEARVDQLKELVKAGQIDFYELRGRDVVLYRRAMAPGESRKVVLSCVAAVPGRYTGQASRGYLYYTDEDKCWGAPLAMTISPRS